MADILSQLDIGDLLGGGYEEEDSDSSDSSGEPVNTGERKSRIQGSYKTQTHQSSLCFPSIKKRRDAFKP